MPVCCPFVTLGLMAGPLLVSFGYMWTLHKASTVAFSECCLFTLHRQMPSPSKHYQAGIAYDSTEGVLSKPPPPTVQFSTNLEVDAAPLFLA